MRRHKLALLIEAAHVAHAQEDTPRTRWTITLGGDEVPPAGRHIGLLRDRDRDPLSSVVIFRRKANPGEHGNGGHIHVVDQAAQIGPAFMYPETFRKQYYPAFDTSQHPIPPGTQLGVWTVVGSFDGDPAHPIIDTVEPGGSYVYALVPAEQGLDPARANQRGWPRLGRWCEDGVAHQRFLGVGGGAELGRHQRVDVAAAGLDRVDDRVRRIAIEGSDNGPHAELRARRDRGLARIEGRVVLLAERLRVHARRHDLRGLVAAVEVA